MRDGVQRRRAPDLRALRDLDLLAEGDAAVAGEMERERPRRRAGRGILVDAGAGDEHARLPPLSVSREAVGPFAQQFRERAHVRTQPNHVLAAS